MLIEGGTGHHPDRQSSTFWWRLTDNLFRRMLWFLVPVVALGAVGLVQANAVAKFYQSSGTLTAASNPLLPAPTVAGVSQEGYESTADTVVRIINERLATDAFVSDIAERAGLSEAVEAGVISLGVIRDNVFASPQGRTTLTVNARWADPQSTVSLVNATIAAYSTFLRDTVASDAAEAEMFYQSQLDELEARREAVQTEYQAFVSELPPLAEDESFPFDIQVIVEQLQADLDAVNASIATAQSGVDAARLNQAQLRSQAGRSFGIIDEPVAPYAPESVRNDQITTFATFLLLGVIVAVSALLVTTVLDRSVNSASAILALPSVPFVVTVPELRIGKNRRLSLRRGPVPEISTGSTVGT
jgi:hypothetical protein